MNSVLSCFFPSTVVLIDDNEVFLDSLVDVIRVNNITFKIFSNPKSALDFINESTDINSLDSSDFTIAGEETTSEYKSMLVNTNSIHSEIYSFDRFSKISAIVVDYVMPGMTGVELCSQIKNSNIQKILLTGIIDETIAIEAFNNGYINKFIKKNGVDFDEELSTILQKAVHQYFAIYTSDLLKCLPSNEVSHLKDPVFANFFYNTCLNKSYAEYYMLDTFGSYLFLTETGQASLLSVTTESEMDRLIDIARDSGEAPKEVLDSLISREYMLVKHDRTGQLPPISEWESYLRPARRLEGYQTYFFNFAESRFLDIDFKRIKSYHEFQINLGK